eukprot:GHUV01022301.1.p1 GENE.GHUV01022301.1~~GHUV01022301.1.p1  ORF type:complete len:116 (+),score=31.95 GHUV01022301.1:141-488(+)
MAFQIDIKSTDSFKSEVLGTPGTLQVVECYSEWAGPCKAIQSTLKALYFSLSDRPLKFYTVNVDKVHGFEQYRGKCQPVFLLYQDGSVKQTITGVQAPPLVQAITNMSAAVKASA